MVSGKTVRDLEELKTGAAGYWGRRLVAELQYLLEASRLEGGACDGELERAVGQAKRCFDRDEVLTADCARQAERELAGLEPLAKKYRILCLANAHIDMNWQWSYAETVAVTLDTFRTVLWLMEEYPAFTFSQSQASVYEIVERHHPALLDRIKRRVHEGRWEVIASTWVEADKNLPSGESMARHILYTRRYLSRLLGLTPDSFALDFEPDTFGHSANVPEILASGGVRYYYHGRGLDRPNVFVWEAPSGAGVLAYREPHWYNLEVRADFAFGVPEFCSRNHIDAMPLVYGVGDHGGGPTRRDLERIVDMSTWPLYPRIGFGTFRELFAGLESARDRLPVVRGELNFTFSGCYSSQSMIKRANRIAEARLNEAEIFSAMSAAFAEGRCAGEQFGRQWRKVLFNQFHDILPGTGVTETREYALGQLQEVMATANTQASIAFEAIASRIDLSSMGPDETGVAGTQSEGAGTGYGVTQLALPQVERGRGRTRIYHFCNPSAHARHEVAELTVWDWPGNEQRLRVRDHRGRTVDHQVVGRNRGNEADGGFAGHTYIKLLVDVEVPAIGYASYRVDEDDVHQLSTGIPTDARMERPDTFVLENELVRAAFSSGDLSLVSFADKQSGRELVDGKRGGAAFRLVQEDGSKGLTSWVMGRHMSVTPLGSNAKVREMRVGDGLLRQWISYALPFGSSSLKVTVSVDRGLPRLVYDIECDWHERGSEAAGVPQLAFRAPLACPCTRYRYDIPAGTIDRDGLDMDVPANSWIVGLPAEAGAALMLATTGTHSYRGCDDALSATLIRGSYEPDPCPENGIHRCTLALFAVRDTGGGEPADRVYDLCHALPQVSAVRGGSVLPPAGSFAWIEGDGIRLAAVKVPEDCTDGSALIFRLVEARGVQTKVVVGVAGRVREAYLVDIHEQRIAGASVVKVDDGRVEFVARPCGIASLCVVLDRRDAAWRRIAPTGE